MKTIKHIKQLKAERKHLRQQQELLEQKIKKDWVELKEELHPKTMAKAAFNKWTEKKAETPENGESILSSTLSYGASLLAKKMAANAEKRWPIWFKSSKK